MSSSRKTSFFKTVAFRLTLLYSGIFLGSMIVAFWFVTFMTSRVLVRQMDDDLLEDSVLLSQTLRDDGYASLVAELADEALAEGAEEVFFRLFDNDGNELFATDTSSWGDLKPDDLRFGTLRKTGDFFFATQVLPASGTDARILVARISNDVVLQAGETMEEGEEFLGVIYDIFGKTIIFIVLFSAVTGWLMAKRSMKGVEDVTQAAIKISKGDLDKRVPVDSRGHEIERLATAFNFMISRIQSLLNGIREVTENIAHDLRTPLTRIRGHAETTLLMSHDIDDFKTMAGDTVAECDNLLSLINDMLDISEAEVGVGKMDMQAFDLSRTVMQACELFGPLAEEKNISVKVTVPDECQMRGDVRRIQRMISNLIDNAIKYTPAGGDVSVTLNKHPERVEIMVRDTGIGIADYDLPNIFQRFYRCDLSRSQQGNGLGLSLAKAIANAHGGRLDVSSHPGSGSRFTAILPVSR